MAAKKHKPTMTLDVVGLQYRLTKSMIRVMAANCPLSLSLVREPDNLHDENAVAVHLIDVKMKNINGLKIGYIRKEVAAKLAPALDKGSVKVRAAVLKSVFPDEHYGEFDLSLDKIADRV